MTDSMNYEAVYRTDPATQGLLNSSTQGLRSLLKRLHSEVGVLSLYRPHPNSAQ